MRRPLARRALRALGRGLLVAALALVGWVALYRLVNPPATLLILAEGWRLGATRQDWRALDAISPHLARAVVAAEDARFCAHWGVDLAAVEQAWAERARGRFRGASTLSQQTAKNVFLWPGRDWARKALEVPFTLAIEAIWGKRRILEVYLNVAEFGPGLFGAEAAARAHFDRPAAELTLAQAARLAAVLPNPRARDPARLGPALQRRARAIAAGAETLRAEGRDRCWR